MSYGSMDIPATGGKYLRIEAGKPAHIHILTPSDQVRMKKVYYDGKTYVELMKNDPVPGEFKVETRWVIDVYDRNDKTVKEFEFGPNIAIGIKEIAKVLEMDGQTIHDVDLYISRVSEKPVRYQVVQRKMSEPVPSEVMKEWEEKVPF